MDRDSESTCERTREGRGEKSRIDFVISKSSSEWSPIKSTKLLSDYWAKDREWKVNLEKKVEERSAVDWKKLEKVAKNFKEKESDEEEES